MTPGAGRWLLWVLPEPPDSTARSPASPAPSGQHLPVPRAGGQLRLSSHAAAASVLPKHSSDQPGAGGGWGRHWPVKQGGETAQTADHRKLSFSKQKFQSPPQHNSEPTFQSKWVLGRSLARCLCGLMISKPGRRGAGAQWLGTGSVPVPPE